MVPALSDARMRIAMAAASPLAIVVDLWLARPGVPQLSATLLCE
jgi:hypothetical protein